MYNDYTEMQRWIISCAFPLSFLHASGTASFFACNEEWAAYTVDIFGSNKAATLELLGN